MSWDGIAQIIGAIVGAFLSVMFSLMLVKIRKTAKGRIDMENAITELKQNQKERKEWQADYDKWKTAKEIECKKHQSDTADLRYQYTSIDKSVEAIGELFKDGMSNIQQMSYDIREMNSGIKSINDTITRLSNSMERLTEKVNLHETDIKVIRTLIDRKDD